MCILSIPARITHDAFGCTQAIWLRHIYQALADSRRALKHAPRPARGAVRGPERLRGAPVRVEAREQQRRALQQVPRLALDIEPAKAALCDRKLAGASIQNVLISNC